ncbi:Rhodanese-related sulfurtransferase [hydrothermal vent metagenome]|uniref:Rhodanese-related sulfurtransferase n=1 Tax=hydrothermal vent metagenome TaxID=652676 RepID=A0A3B0R3R3_9ZZZZ
MSKASKSVSRRWFLLGAVVAIPAGVYAYQRTMYPTFDGDALTPQQAHEFALAGKIALIDIRRPDEWAKTGSAGGGHRIDMRDDDFVAQLMAITGGKKDVPVALICAAGVRSARLSNRLTKAGFSRIIDVPEGMLGSRAGPGWIKRGLPVEQS